jgi:hypothetical protein
MEAAPVPASAARAPSAQGNQAISYLRQVAAAAPTLEGLGLLAGNVASEMQIFLVDTDGSQSSAMETSELAIAYLLAAARQLPVVAPLSGAAPKWSDVENSAAHTLRDVLQVRTHFRLRLLRSFHFVIMASLSTFHVVSPWSWMDRLSLNLLSVGDRNVRSKSDSSKIYRGDGHTVSAARLVRP